MLGGNGVVYMPYFRWILSEEMRECSTLLHEYTDILSELSSLCGRMSISV